MPKKMAQVKKKQEKIMAQLVKWSSPEYGYQSLSVCVQIEDNKSTNQNVLFVVVQSSTSDSAIVFPLVFSNQQHNRDDWVWHCGSVWQCGREPSSLCNERG